MSTGRSMHSGTTGSCRRFCVIAIAAFVACFCTESTSEAKPQIAITFCGAASGGQAGFYLYWVGPGNGTPGASNYIWTYLYDANGNPISGYPIEDQNDYVIPATQVGAPGSSCSATGTESDSAPGAATVMLNDSGDWNGASTGYEPAGYAGHGRARHIIAARSGLTPPMSDPTVPVITLPPSSVYTNSNASLQFSGNNVITVTDPAGTNSPEQATLRVSNGTLSGVNPVAGSVTVTGSTTPVLVVTATTPSNLTNALATLTYTPNNNYTGADALVLSDTNTSNGLVSQVVVPITVNSAVPTITAPLRLSTTVGAQLTIGPPNYPAINIAVNGGASDTMTLSVSNGTLTLPTHTGLTTYSGPGTPTLVLAGPLASLNTDLPSLVYTPNSGYAGTDTLTIVDRDNNNNLSQTTTVPIPVAWITGPASVSTTVNGSTSIKGISVGTPTVGDQHTLTLSVNNGTLSETQISGTAAAITTNLGLLVYTPTWGYSGNDTLTLQDTDTTANLKTTAQISIAVIQNVVNPGSSPTLKVKLEGKMLAHGETSKYNVSISVQNLSTTTDVQKVRFVYAVFAKTDAVSGHIIPIKQTDVEGNRRMFNVITHGSAQIDTQKKDYNHSGVFDYRIPKNSTTLVGDLQVDLGKGVAAGDVAYVDVWVIDQDHHEHYYLDRLQITP